MDDPRQDLRRIVAYLAMEQGGKIVLDADEIAAADHLALCYRIENNNVILEAKPIRPEGATTRGR